MIAAIILALQILTFLFFCRLFRMAAIADQQAERDYLKWKQAQLGQATQNEDTERDDP